MREQAPLSFLAGRCPLPAFPPPRLWNPSVRGWETEQGGVFLPDAAAWLRDYSSMSTARTGRPSLPFKRTVSAACLWFNFCFLFHGSPENCWGDHVSPFLPSPLQVAGGSPEMDCRPGTLGPAPGTWVKVTLWGVALGTASLPVLTIVCCRSLLFPALSYWKSFKMHENRAEFPDPLHPASPGDDP